MKLTDKELSALADWNRRMAMERSGCASPFVGVAMFIVAVVVMLTSCKHTEYVTVTERHTDTCYVANYQRDSIYVHDSTTVREKGDTVIFERWHNQYIERQVHDTCYVSRHDTIPQPYPVIREVNTQLSLWQRLRLALGNLTLFVAVVAVGLWFFRSKIHKL